MGAGLLVQELDEIGLGAATVVILGGGASLGEKLDRGEAGNAVLLSGLLAVGGIRINLGDGDLGLAGKGSGELLPGRSEVLAVLKFVSTWLSRCMDLEITYGRTREQ